MDSQNRNLSRLHLLVIAVLFLTTVLSAVQTYMNHQNHKTQMAALKEVVYARAGDQARTQLQMLRFLEADDSASARQLSASLLRGAESTLANYSPPVDETEASRAIAAVRKQIAEYRGR